MEIWESIQKIPEFDTFFENIKEEDRDKYNSYSAWKNYIAMNFKG